MIRAFDEKLDGLPEASTSEEAAGGVIGA